MQEMLERFRSDAIDRRLCRVVIVGAGAAGLSALSALKRKGNCEVLLLEKQAHIGGVWRQCNYPGLTIHARSYSFRFYDFHSPKSLTAHATRDEILEYFESYIAYLNLDDHIHRNQRVTKIVYNESKAVAHKCQIEVENGTTRQKYILRCDYVVCALGFSNAGEPIIPNFPGEEKFLGQTLHSSAFTNEILEKIKRERSKVCLLGAGKSAYDLALQFEKHGVLNQTVWVYRKSLWGLSYEFLYSNREDKADLFYKHGKYLYLIRRYPNSPMVPILAEQVAKGGVVLNLENNLSIHESRSAIYKTAEIELLRAKATRVKSAVKCLTERALRLENGEDVEADYIVCCTGYARAKNIPPIQMQLDSGDTIKIDPTDQKLLYRGMIDWRIPGIIFFTGEALFAAQLFGFSVAAEWAAGYIEYSEKVGLDLPSMKLRVAEDDAVLNGQVQSPYLYSWATNQKGGDQSYGYFSGEAVYRYLQQVLSDLGILQDVGQLYAASMHEETFENVSQFIQSSMELRLAKV